MYYIKAEGVKIYAINTETGNKSLIPPSLPSILNKFPGLREKHFRSIAVFIKLAIKTKEYMKTYEEITTLLNNKNKHFFTVRKFIYFGHPLRSNNIKIDKGMLNASIKYPSIIIGGEVVKGDNLRDLISLAKTSRSLYGEKIVNNLNERDLPGYLYNSITYSGEKENIMSDSFQDFFFFHDKLFFGNVNKCEHICHQTIKETISTSFYSYNVSELISLKNTLNNYPEGFKLTDNILEHLPQAINFHLVLSEKEKSILKEYKNLINKDTDIHDDNFSNKYEEEIHFFKYIYVIGSHMNLYQLYQLGIGQVDNIVKSIDLIV